MAFPTTVTITPTIGSRYTWAGAGFNWAAQDATKSWDEAYPVSYALNVGEGWSTGDALVRQYTLAPREGWLTAEFWSQVFDQLLVESLLTNECWMDIWDPVLRIYDSWVMSDVLANTATVPVHDAWQTAEASSRAPEVVSLEAWQTGEAWLQKYQLAPQEGWNTEELASREANPVFLEAWQIVDVPPVWDAVLSFYEAWINGETMTHVWQDFLTFVEGWTTSELQSKDVRRPIAESWHTAEKLTRASTKGIEEALHTAEALDARVSFQRLCAEAWRLADTLSKEQIAAILEALHMNEAYLRNANAVISDLAFAPGDLTLEQFTGLVSSPAGYGPFTDFLPGELEYQKALIALVLAGPLTTGRPQITEWELSVDVPNLTDSGTLALEAKNTFIPFKTRFFAPPEVIVQLRGGSTGTPDITGITDAGFYLQILGANGQPVAGDVVWSAVGY